MQRFKTAFATLALAIPSLVQAQLEWPQQIDRDQGSIIIYQPQPETLTGNELSGRAAISLELQDRDQPIFGVMWFTARLDTDRDSDTAFVRDLRVDHVTWPESKDAGEQQFTAVVEDAFPENGLQISLERLGSSLETAEVVQRSLEDLNTDPPAIEFREELSVLLLIDGPPRYSDIENSDYRRVMNAPMAVACNKKGKGCWLYSGKFWYEAGDPLGPWTPSDNPPRDLARSMPPAEEDPGAPSSPPAIVVATEPTELIVTDGPAEWTPLTGGELLYVSNTESPWLRELTTGNMYLLLSGRWYRSKQNGGPWTFVQPDELPPSFAQIPPASEIGGLRTSVAGTPEAEDAVRDQAIPQTAAIRRSEASLTVEYDGKPKFEKIRGTDVSYAVNTGAQVLEIDKRFYAVDDGVWFTSVSASGPWSVADEVPEEQIAEIPPDSPVYNTTHVHVYESTPDVVYVGYTPGYLWSYPYYGVPVYGTGWYYPPYYGRRYYPRPPTWGFNVGYNPWTGWNFGMSWSNGFFSFGVSWGGGWGGSYRPWGCCGGWYGGGYRGPTVINTGDINIGNSVNVGNRAEIANRIGNEAKLGDRFSNRSDNLYNRPENRARNADRATALGDLKAARPARGRANDVFADQSGKVARRDGDQWQTRENGQWKDAAAAATPEQRDQARGRAQDRMAQAAPEQREQARDLAADRMSARPESRPSTQPSTRDSSRLSSRPASRPSSRPSGRPQSRPMGGSLNTRDLNRSYNARQRGASREMSRPVPRGGGRMGARRR